MTTVTPRVIISTCSSLPGFKVVEQRDVNTQTHLSTLPPGMDHQGYVQAITSAVSEAISQLGINAANRGVHAVIGITHSYQIDVANGIVTAVATGSLVLLEACDI